MIFFKVLSSWKHHNLLFLVLGLVLTFFLSQNQRFNQILGSLGSLGLPAGGFGAFLAGMMFASTFTLATGMLILLNLAKNMNIFVLVILAALGAITMDFLLFKFFKDEVAGEIVPIYEEITGSHLKKILHTRYFGWTLPVLGALIIASPLPDELGISLMGIEQIRTNKFILISLLSHTLGIMTLVTVGKIL